MTSIAKDARYAIRRLATSPGFTVAAALTLALVIGANTTIFSLVNAVLLRPPAHVSNPERLVSLYDVLGTRMRLGRDFLPDESVRGGPAVAVISHTLWETRFNADP